MSMNYQFAGDMIRCQICSDANGVHPDVWHLPPECKPTNPEPTLTCSEVVDKIAWCISIDNSEGYARWKLDREQATAILHSWRERRVQELEDLLAKHSLSPEPQSTQPGTDSENK